MSRRASIPPDEQIATLARRCERILTGEDLRAKLVASAKSGQPLRVKLGLDPTAPDVTLGHCVPLKVVRQFQEWGHKAVLVIGDYTARIGDPSGVNTTRPMLSPEQIDANAATYIEQLGKVVLTDPQHLEVRRNGEWLAKLTFADILRLASRKTVAQVLERDDFRKRFEEGREIHLHELLYPLMQGYDSVAIAADIEMGGSDQLFNNLVGREFQKAEAQSPPNGQVVIVTPLLVGTDGRIKMSKSKGNYIGVTDPPGGDGGMFGKVMSLSDDVMPLYYRLLTEVPEAEYGALIKSSPRDAKVRLAKLIIQEFHDDSAADLAERDFMAATHGGMPAEIEELRVGPGPHSLVGLLVRAGFVVSNSEAIRSIRQGGVKLDGEKTEDTKAEVHIGAPKVLQLGKRKFVRLV
jgi:tyrosyl-tRNA synthetase